MKQINRRLIVDLSKIDMGSKLEQRIEDYSLENNLFERQVDNSVSSKAIFLSIILPFIVMAIGFIFIIFWIRLVASKLGIPVGFALILRLGSIGIIINNGSVTKVFGLARINIPFYVVKMQGNRIKYILFPLWLLKNFKCNRTIELKSLKYIGVNLTGCLIPVSIACYQLYRTSIYPILIIFAIAVPTFYFGVKIIPGRGIIMNLNRLRLMALFAAVLAIFLAERGYEGSVAYAGITLGSLFGADLLHLKDIKPGQAGGNLHIGGAGWNDGIAVSGFVALLLTELLLKLQSWL